MTRVDPTTTEPTTTAISNPPPATIVTRDGVELCYDTIGNPADPALLLIQGLSAQLIGWHPDFCTQLADLGFYVIRHDNRDIGLSDHFPAGGYTLTDMARDSAELLTALDILAAHVVGQSMGGMVAQELAITHPGSVRSLTLIYTTAHTHNILTEAVDGRRHVPPGRNRAEAIELYAQNEAPCASPRYPHDDAWLRELGGLMYDRDHDPATSERQLAAIYATPDRRPALPNVDVPTAILHGDHDRLIDPAAAKELHGLISGSTLTIYPGMGHSLPRDLWTDITTEIHDNATRTS